MHHVVDNEEAMGRDGVQAVVWQAALGPVFALELLAAGVWQGAGVLGAEAFDAVPFLDLLADHGSPQASTSAIRRIHCAAAGSSSGPQSTGFKLQPVAADESDPWGT